MESKYVSSTELAKHFAVSVPTVRQWMRRNKIPPTLYIKVGTAYRFMLTEIEQHFFSENARRIQIKKAATKEPNAPEQLELPLEPKPVTVEDVTPVVEDEEHEVFSFDADDDV